MGIRTEKVTFAGSQGSELAARLDRPHAAPRACALFAHCFTCSKDSAAASRISRALARLGIAVLRFDFTGLGGSDGEFENTSFSSNIDDLVCAADFMRGRFEAPRILVGHSLGGAAVLAAAARIPEVSAVATVNAPFDPAHVTHLLGDSTEEIARSGQARVSIAGRSFTLRAQFLDDITSQQARRYIADLRRPLLIFHAPDDTVVDVDNARLIYQAAGHPKSFVSLPGAGHLLRSGADAEYVGAVLVAWASRYVTGEQNAEPQDAARDEVVVTESGEGKYHQRIVAGRHALAADEPVEKGGDDRGPTPYELVLAGLGACTTMTLRMYADHKGLVLEPVSVRLSHQKVPAAECPDAETETGKVDVIERELTIRGELTEAQRERLLQMADKCPVHRSLHSEVVVRSRLAE